MKTLLKSLAIVLVCCTPAFAEPVNAPTDPEMESVIDLTNPVKVRANATAHEMVGIWHSMRWAKTDEARLLVLEAVAKRYWLSVVQVEVLLETITNIEKRVSMLATLYPRITNPLEIERLKRLLPPGTSPSDVTMAPGNESTALL